MVLVLLKPRRRLDANSYVNTINTWAEPHNANGVTPNSIIDSNDEPPCNNQQRMIQRGYRNRSSCVGASSCGIGASGPLVFGGITFDDSQASAAWLADSDNGATGLAMTGSDQGAYNSYSAVHTYWADTTAMDNIRGADITDGTIAGSAESISGNVTHTDSNLAAPRRRAVLLLKPKLRKVLVLKPMKKVIRRVRFNDVTPTVSKFWEGPVEMPTYTNAEIEAYSCVAGDVACNAAPAVPSPADAWSGTINNARRRESVAFDTGYAGSNGLEPQSWVNGNGTSYIYFGSGEFDGQGSGHDYLGTLYMPSTGSINNCDGGRSHTYCDYRQERRR